MAGLRHNKHKTPMHLLPWDAIGALADHYGKGAKKYPERNWEKGLKWNEGCAASLVRHLKAWSSGEDYELENMPDGSCQQMYHDESMLWNAMALVTFRLRGIGVDDRVKLVSAEGVPLEMLRAEPLPVSQEPPQYEPYLAPLHPPG
jgi:hypothetical protein